jgi:glucose-1-phosphate thymidylyltransferase
VINETKHQLLGYFGSGARFGCSFSYVVQETYELVNGTSPSPGLAQALDSGYHLTTGKIVLFGMPDTIIQPKGSFRIGLSQFSNDTDLLLCLFPTSTPQKFGMVRYDSAGKVLEIIDKPRKTDLEYMWGGMIWGPRFTEYLHKTIIEKNFLDFAQIINRAILDGYSVRSIPFPGGNFIDLGTYDEIKALDQQLREDI